MHKRGTTAPTCCLFLRVRVGVGGGRGEGGGRGGGNDDVLLLKMVACGLLHVDAARLLHSATLDVYCNS